MMDLALEIGWPVGLLSHAMSEREFARWLAYIYKRKLPSTRIEMYLAQLTYYVVAVAGGNKEAKLGDYILDFESKPAKASRKPADDDDDDADVDELKQVLQFKPRGKRGT